MIEELKGVVNQLTAYIRLLQTRLSNPDWSNIDNSYPNFKEKGPSTQALATEEASIGIMVHTMFTRNSIHGLAPNQALWGADTLFNQSLRRDASYVSNSISDVSSLSSGFGDGDIVMPRPAAKSHTTTQRHSSILYDPSQRPETTYSESTDGGRPRFRPMSSWVRHQAGRVERAKQDELDASDPTAVVELPLEQEFAMMMPDGQEPRLVDMTPGDME